MELSEKSGEEGFVLVFTLLLMVVLMLLGTSAIDTSIFESSMSANDALYKRAFYEADGGTEIGLKLTYDNAICVQVNGGFNEDAATPGTRAINNIAVNDLDFSSPQTLASIIVSDANRAAAYYPDGVVNDTAPHSNLLMNGAIQYTPGSGLQMVSGYEGLGASSAAGGSHLQYSIYSQHQGARQSESLVTLGWRLSTHIINNASTSDCDAVLYRN
jgi:hypothetical protein